jgi:excisionase family DNA binding protein
MELLSVKELSRTLKLKHSVIYKMIKNGCPHIRLGGYKFIYSDVVEWIRANSKKVNK